MKLKPSTVLRIKSALPSGAGNKIAEMTGKLPSSVSRELSMMKTDYDDSIIIAAVTILSENCVSLPQLVGDDYPVIEQSIPEPCQK